METLYTCGIQIKPQVRGNLNSHIRQNESCDMDLRLYPKRWREKVLNPVLEKKNTLVQVRTGVHTSGFGNETGKRNLHIQETEISPFSATCINHS